MKPIRLIAMDMDGTLLNSEQRITPTTVSTLRAAMDAGVKLAICSGRAPGDNALFALENGLTDCAILSLNGAYCMETPVDRPFLNRRMDDATAGACIRWMREMNITFCACLQNRLVVVEGAYREAPFFWSSHRNQPGAPEMAEGWDALRAVWAQGVNKILCLEADDGILSALHQRLLTLPELDITSSWPQDLELMPKNACKGEAVYTLAQKLGLTADQVMAVGDYDNDLTMIEYAGLGVAMGNASPRIKAAANRLTLTNDEDGVAAAIRRFVLN